MRLHVLPILSHMPYLMLTESSKYLFSLFRLLAKHKLGLLVAEHRISLAMLALEASEAHLLSKRHIPPHRLMIVDMAEVQVCQHL
jgi:hypothetical protein